MSIHVQVFIYISVFNSPQFSFDQCWYDVVLFMLLDLIICVFVFLQTAYGCCCFLTYLEKQTFVLNLFEVLKPFVFNVLLIFFSLNIPNIYIQSMVSSFSYIIFSFCPASFWINLISFMIPSCWLISYFFFRRSFRVDKIYLYQMFLQVLLHHFKQSIKISKQYISIISFLAFVLLSYICFYLCYKPYNTLLFFVLSRQLSSNMIFNIKSIILYLPYLITLP